MIPAARMTGRPLGLALVGVSTLMWSSAGFFVRLIPLDVWTLVGWRSVLSCATLLGWAVWTRRGRLRAPGATFGWRGALYVPFAATGMLAYIVALSVASVANVLVVYATLPFVAAALGFLLLGERPDRAVTVASLVAFLGVAVMAAAGVAGGETLGLVLSFVMTAAFAVTVVLARRWPRFDVTLAIAAASATVALVCLAVAVATAGRVVVPTAGQFGLIFLFSLCTQSLSYVLFLAGGRLVRSAEAGLVALLDVVLGPLWVWLAFGEVPAAAALAGGALTFGAVAWYLARQLR